MIIFDTLISLLDIVTRYLEYDYVFQPERCGTESNYLIIYIAIVTVSLRHHSLAEAFSIIILGCNKLGVD